MRKINSYLLLLPVLILLAGIQSCDPSEPLPETERITNVLTSTTWKVQSVAVDGTDQTNVYKGLTLTFSATGFTSVNGGAVWPTSGTWKFSDDTAKTILRSDGTLLMVNEATDNKVVIALTWSQTTLGGRSASVKGSNVFTFVR